MEGAFVTVVPGRFAFIAPEGGGGNILVSGAALAALSRMPRRGERARFQIAERPDGRRRAIDLVLTEAESATGGRHG